MILSILTHYLTFLYISQKISNVTSTGTKKVNGKQCDDDLGPYMVSLFNTDIGTNFCSGTLLSDQFILTAAHCLEEVNSTDKIRIIHDKTIHKITNFHMHPMYVNFPFFYNDIAVINLHDRINKSGSDVDYVNLPRGGCSKGIGEICAQVDAVGWKKSNSRRTSLKFLKCRQLPPISKDQCQLEMLYGGTWIIEENIIICVYNPQQAWNICGRDSGAPIFCGGRQVGVASFSHEKSCKRNKIAPSVYTKVDCYLKFIYTAIENSGGQHYVKTAGVEIDKLEDIDMSSCEDPESSSVNGLMAAIGLVLMPGIHFFVI